VRGLIRRLGDYWMLAKPRPTVMALITVMAGYQIGLRHRPSLSDVLHLALGALLAGAGANAFNQWIERDADRKMKRTQNRPMASGRMSRKALSSRRCFRPVVGCI
jgi:heme o synthase